MTVSTAGPIAVRRTPSLAIAREIAQVLVAFLVYNVGRMLATQDLGRADTNAHGVLDAERWLRLPSEATVQSWALGHDWMIELANRYYVSVHFPLTIAALVWLYRYRYRRPAYHWAKRALLIATGVALVFHVLTPVTPPRLLTSLGMVDTGHAGGMSIYQAPVLGSMSNEYAAMPSLHVGWALLIAIVMIAACRTPWRWLWLLHPVATVFVVVSTANHYWLDGIAGAALVLGSLWLASLWLGSSWPGSLWPAPRGSMVRACQTSIAPHSSQAPSDSPRASRS